MRTKTIIRLVFVLLVGTVATLFTIQNLSREADLSLSLGFTGVHLATPMPLPYLLWIAFGLGLLLGVLWGVAQRMSANKRVRELQKKYARNALQSK